MTCKRATIGLLVTIAGLCWPVPAVFAQDIFIVGDSTASTYGPMQYPRTGWGQVLGDFYAEDVSVINLAKSGRSARSFINEGFFADLEKQLGFDDILLIQFGHNDQKKYSPERYAQADTAFKEYLRKYISLAHQKNAKPVLLTPVVRRKFEAGKLVPTHGDYPGAVRDLALEAKVPLIDMTRLSGQFVGGLGEQASKAIYLHQVSNGKPVEDNTHFSERGAYAMAALVARELARLQIVTRSIDMPEFTHVEQDGVGELTPELVFNGKWGPVAHLAEIKVQIANREIRNITQ